MTDVITKPIHRLLERVQRRFHRSRRGSVLILVVALLVLMALIGTAFITTTRTDRYAAVQHTKNVQIDLIAEGVVSMAVNQIRDDLYAEQPGAPGVKMLRQTVPAGDTSRGYEHFDGVGMQTPIDKRTRREKIPGDLWLNARTPRLLEPNAAMSGSNPPVWDLVTYPLIQNSFVNANVLYQFDPPDHAIGSPFFLDSPYDPYNNASESVTVKPWFEPTVKEVPASSGIFHPALRAWRVNPANGQPAPDAQLPTPFLAADADGDGVADAGLWKLPIGRVDGVTYYAAVRILDNNSAVNVNTAWSNREFDGAGNSSESATTDPYHPRYYTPASVGLAEMLRTTDLTARTAAAQGAEIKELYEFRFGENADVDGTYRGAAGNAYDDKGAALGSFRFQSLNEALHAQLGARIGNPGFVSGGPGAAKAQAMSVSDSIALAYHFTLLNPDATPGALETTLANASPTLNSVYSPKVANYNTKQSAYATTVNGVQKWFQEAFYFENATQNQNPPNPSAFMQRRALLTASNPVSNTAPVHPLLGTLTAPYPLDAGIEPYGPAGAMNYAPPRVSINQAPFAELWRAYWNVMAEEKGGPIIPGNAALWVGTPFDLRIIFGVRASAAAKVRVGANLATDPPTFNNPYLGMEFTEYDETNPLSTGGYDPVDNTSYSLTTPVNGGIAEPTDYHPARMFRSSLRAVPDYSGTPPTPFTAATPRFNAHQQMLLRAAIAAVNAIDLRDSDDNITAERIQLTATAGGGGAGAPVTTDVVVYGTERQPFITEVYAEAETGADPTGAGTNPCGYVAVELYNPYDEDIVLTNWKIVAIDRRPTLTAGAPSPPPYNNNAPGGTPHTGQLGAAPQHTMPLDNSTLIADLDPDPALHPLGQDVFGDGTGTAAAPLVVPARGYLLLENYYDAAYAAPVPPPLAARYRPAATGLPPTGVGAAIQANWGTDTSPMNKKTPTASVRGTAVPQLNIACVPGLSGVIDANWGVAEWASGIRSVFNRELVFLRPRRADGQYSSGVYVKPGVNANPDAPPLGYNEAPNFPSYSNLRDLVPVDSFDFTGLTLPIPAAPDGAVPAYTGALWRDPLDPIDVALASTARAWHYVRQNVEPGAIPSSDQPSNWKFVYPGRYDADPGDDSATNTRFATLPPAQVAYDPRPRQQGTQVVSYLNGDVNPWIASTIAPRPNPMTVPTLGGTDPVLLTPNGSNGNRAASYPRSFKVPIGNVNFRRHPLDPDLGISTVGANPLTTAGTVGNENIYPFGGFARDGDMLQVPFIGAYRVTYRETPTPAAPWYVAELNAITMDAAFAEDTDLNDDPVNNRALPATGDDAPAPGGGGGTIERENVGRFLPLRVVTAGSPPSAPDYASYNPASTPITPGPLLVNDFGLDPSYEPGVAGPPPVPQHGFNWEPYWRYKWADDLFDHLAVRSPADDYMPNYPMQKEWVEPVAGYPAPVYHPGDLISFYNPASTSRAHEIYLVTGATPLTVNKAFPADQGGPLIPAFTCRAVQNTADTPAAMRHTGSLAVADVQRAHGEDNAPVEGLININTASWRVLSTLPLIVNPTTGLPDEANTPYGVTYRQLNEQMARAIVYFRDIDAHPSGTIRRPHGPFRSIFELNKVYDFRAGAPAIPATQGYPPGTLPGFMNGYGLMPLSNAPAVAEADDGLGDHTPINPLGPALTAAAARKPDGSRGDWEERFLQLTRISNMVTTRSDSFLVYVLVQGWENAETDKAKLKVQRRFGYLIDRSRVSPDTPDVIKQQFYNN